MKLHKKSCGVIPVYYKDNEPLFLIVHQTNGIWCFPKGGQKKDEDDKQTALREVREEVGITEISLLDDFNIEERYSAELDGISYTKEVKYFIGICDNKSVITQEEEIQNYKWIKFEEASNYFSYESTMNTLYEANNFLKKTPRC